MLAAVACAGDSQQRAGSDRDRLLVSAAASLTEAFVEIRSSFEAVHPQFEVELNFAGSSTLREQVLEGAPVDVFASADWANMDQLAADGQLSGEPTVFARNRLQIGVPAGNPARIGGLQAFANPRLLIGLCAEPVPCGEFARQALARAGITPEVDSDEPDVRALMTKLEAGELDAGIVYATDLLSSGGKVDGLEIPSEFNVVAEYPIAVLTHAPNPSAAADFVAFVLSEQGQDILASFGFTAP
jgi:molybdate transport system substrate-binding protein